MTNENCNELHKRLIKLRKDKNLTQVEVANILGVDSSTYAHYESGRRTPNIERLRILADMYGLVDQLLGAELPLVVEVKYPEEKIKELKKVLIDCKGHTDDYEIDKMEYNKLREALKPLLDIRNDALDLPAIDISNIPENTTVKVAHFDTRAETLIKLCIDKQFEVMGWR